MRLRLYYIILALLYISGCCVACNDSNKPAKENTSDYRFSSYNGLVMAGYQGWFSAQGCESNRGWYHYGFSGDNATIDFWPEMSEYSKKYVAPFKMADGSDAYVFSSFDEESVDLHFKWMQEYGIDGVFIQRFVSEVRGGAGKRHFNKVLENALKAARKYDRAIAVYYDLSGSQPSDMEVLVNDWQELQTLFKLPDTVQNPTYVRHNGRMLLGIWGVGFNDNRRYSLIDAQLMLERLKRNHEVSILLGVPYFWRSLSNDTENNPVLHEIIKKNVDIVSPWAIGRYNNTTYAVASQLTGDLQWCANNNLDYAPVVFPGFSWGNLRRTGIYDEIPRLGGDFLWQQVAGAKAAGAKSLYVAMFDEIDEGTAIFKCAEEGNLPVFEDPDKRFVGIEQGVGSDYYLWLVGEATKWIRGETGYGITKPVRNK